MNTIENFRNRGRILKTILYRQNIQKMANSRYRGYNTQTISYWWNTLIMANWDMGGITLKTIINEQNYLKMANSRYGGYNTQNNPYWKSENAKFQIWG